MYICNTSSSQQTLKVKGDNCCSLVAQKTAVEHKTVLSDTPPADMETPVNNQETHSALVRSLVELHKGGLKHTIRNLLVP
jgi:nitrogen-specific signal transduction histidine kinase